MGTFAGLDCLCEASRLSDPLELEIRIKFIHFVKQIHHPTIATLGVGHISEVDPDNRIRHASLCRRGRLLRGAGASFLNHLWDISLGESIVIGHFLFSYELIEMILQESHSIFGAGLHRGNHL